MSAQDSKALMGAVSSEAGVQVNGIVCTPVIDKCEGCERVRQFEEQNYCGSYPNPERKWSLGRCNFATHLQKQTGGGGKVNPLKASKRAARGKK